MLTTFEEANKLYTSKNNSVKYSAQHENDEEEDNELKSKDLNNNLA